MVFEARRRHAKHVTRMQRRADVHDRGTWDADALRLSALNMRAVAGTCPRSPLASSHACTPTHPVHSPAYPTETSVPQPSSTPFPRSWLRRRASHAAIRATCTSLVEDGRHQVGPGQKHVTTNCVSSLLNASTLVFIPKSGRLR